MSVVAPTHIDEQVRLADGDGFPPLDDDFGRHKGCMWGYSVCTEDRTHFIVRAAHDGTGDAEVYCARHWVLMLARDIEVDQDFCGHDLAHHVVRTGALEGSTWCGEQG